MQFCWLKDVVMSVCAVAERSWLRHYATSQKVADYIPHEVNGYFI
jgi:hypothetical protein